MPGRRCARRPPAGIRIDVDEHFAQTGPGRGLHRGLGIDGDRDSRVELGHRAKARVVDRFVREQEVVGEAGAGQPDDLARGRAREGAVPVRELSTCELGALVRLHVRPHARPGKGRGHRREVVLERGRVDDERGRREVADEHAWDYGMS